MTPTEMETILVEVALHVRQLQTDVKDMGGHFDRVEGRLEGVEGRLDRVENRLGSVETNVASVGVGVKNLDLRTTRIEDVLPTLATKEEVQKGLAEVTRDLGARIEESRRETRGLFEDARREARVLFEDVRGDIRMLAEHVARLSGHRGPDR